MSNVSKVTSVQGSGMSGEYFQFEYAFEDGTVIKARHKTNAPKVNVGEMGEYTVKFENDWGKVGSVSKPSDGYNPQATQGASAGSSQGGGGYTPKAGKKSSSNGAFALSYAKDIVCTEIEKGLALTDENALADRTLRIAERFNTWLNNH